MDGKSLTIITENKTSEIERKCNDVFRDTENLTAIETVSLFHCVYLNIYYAVSYQRIFLKRLVEFLNETINPQCNLVIVGSMADGTFLPGISDLDLMHVLNDSLSIDKEYLTGPLKPPNVAKIHIADRKRAAPGYAMLFRAGEMPTDMLSANGKRHASHRLCKVGNPLPNNFWYTENETASVQDIIVCVTGPAWRLFAKQLWARLFDGTSNNIADLLETILGSDSHSDFVDVLPYKGKSILTRWLRRKRRHGWPSLDLLREVSDFTGYLAPVGQKGSASDEHEWRICYTTVEQKLVHSFNEVQFLLYHQLKVFTNTHLKAGKAVLTSYILKNIVFWLSESIPSFLFQHRYFVALFRSTLVLLKSCIDKCYLPNYILPERNLLRQGISKKQKQDILSDLTTNGIETYPFYEWTEVSKNELCETLRRSLSDPNATKEWVSKKMKFMPMYLSCIEVTRKFIFDQELQKISEERLKILSKVLYVTNFIGEKY